MRSPACRIGASMLASDLAAMAADAKRVLAAGSDYLHLDLMDGHFVPNISWGPPVVKALRKHTKGFLDCHLMVSDPAAWVDAIKDAGGDQYTFHLEAAVERGTDVAALCAAIKSSGMKVGVAIKPGTPVAELEPYIALIDMALVMTVEPGFGGQSFMADMMPKVSSLRAKYPDLDIQVDGGLGPSTIEAAAKAGANVIVAGSSVFKGADPAKPIAAMRDAVLRAQGVAPPPKPPPAELTPQEKLKREVGYRAVDAHVRNGMVVGLGTGSTAYYAVERLGQKLASGELSDIVAVPTSVRTEEQARALGITLATLDTHADIDVAIDGADAVDKQLNLVKGGGGALLREKMVEVLAKKFIVIVDESKLCESLGPSFAVPIEVTPFCVHSTMRKIGKLPTMAGGTPRLRTGSVATNKPDGEELATTDNGNYIIDVSFDAPIGDAAAAAAELSATCGVVDHGFFCGMASEVIVAGKDGLYTLHPTSA